MVIVIPTWILWTVGILAGAAILFFAFIGLAFVWAMKDFRLF